MVWIPELSNVREGVDARGGGLSRTGRRYLVRRQMRLDNKLAGPLHRFAIIPWLGDSAGSLSTHSVALILKTDSHPPRGTPG